MRRKPSVRTAPLPPGRPRTLAVAVGAVLWGGLLATSGRLPAAELPVPCGACAGALPFVGAGAIQGGAPTIAGRRMTVRQLSERAILNWQSFDIAAGHGVDFAQPRTSSIALNRIHSADPSRIFGSLTANGQVYLYNANGILFGRGSRVDVNSLVATTLDVDDDVITGGGIVNAINRGPGSAAFDGTSSARIELQPGARIGTDPQGRAILIGADVVNRGTIETPDGQAILAASTDKVYLAAAPSDDPNLRGILVEVGTGGTVTNTGTVVAERGNATLIGHAVNQSGIVRATTSVALNGSVRLLARDQGGTQPDPNVLGRNTVLPGTRGGTLTLDAGSRTEVLPEAGGDTAVDDSAQRRSEILLVGETVRLRGGSTVSARGGVVDITATSDPNAPLAPNAGRNAAARIVMEAGSRIDVSGTTTQLDVTRNLVTAELRGNELRDAPLQRDGALRNARVTVDARKGTRLADLSGDLARLPRTVDERLSAGGDVSLRSEGDVVLHAGSVIDASGGWIDYAGGYLATTKLVTPDGQVVDIGDARPDVLYAGIFGDFRRDYDKWDIVDQFDLLGGRTQRVYSASGRDGRASLDSFAAAAFAEYEPGYREGKDAGRIAITASTAVLDGTLLARAERGRWQRDVPQAPAPDLAGAPFRYAYQRPWTQLPYGGQLVVGDGFQVPANVPDFRVDEVLLAPAPATVAGDVLPADLPLHVDPALLARGGFTRLSVLANGTVTVPVDAVLDLGAAGVLTVEAGGVTVEGVVTAASGDVSLTARQTRSTGAGEADVTLGRRAALDVAGRWVNDSPLLAQPGEFSPLLLDGGEVAIETAGALTLAPGSRIDASAGAWLQADGTLTGGTGGDIALAVDYIDARPLVLGATLASYGLARGGELTLTGPAFRVVPGAGARTGADAVVTLGAGFFAAGGFAAHALNATHGGLTVAAGTRIAPRMLNLTLDADASGLASGGSLLAAGTPGLLRDDLRLPVDLSLRFRPKAGAGALDVPLAIEAGAAIDLDPGARLSISGDTSIVIDGTLSAPAGDIAIELLRTTSRDSGFRADQGIWLGGQARLLARGAVVSTPDPLGLRQGDVLAGGSITLSARRGYIVTAPGSLLDVSGVAATLDLPAGDTELSAGAFTATAVAADTGSIAFTAAEGVLLGGRLAARAAAADARGGALTVALDSNARDSDDPLLNQGFIDFASGPRDIVIGAGFTGSAPAATAVPAALNGQALVGARALSGAGFDVLTLRTAPAGGSAPATPGSTASVRFEGDVDLAAGARIVLDSPAIASDGGRVTLVAPHVALGHAPINFRVDAATTTGSGHLLVEADLVELVGNLATQGFAAPGTGTPGVTLRSRGDLRLRGIRFNTFTEPTLTGRFRTPGDLRIEAAQVYPTTLTDYTLAATGANARIVFATTGAAAAPLSAAGSLTVSASHILQGGTLRAPFGTIALDAGTALVLGKGSLTSVSGAGLLVPYGQTQFGEDWVYVLPGLTRVVATAPDKRVRLDAPDVNLRAGAVIDVAGDGNLLAWEFLPGPGGSRDLLGAGAGDTFAIVPTLGAAFAPWDPAESTAFGYAIGTTFEHSGGGGLAAGAYAVLPARYALLPGAYLVAPTGAVDPPPGVAALAQDGIATVAGRFGVAGGAARDSRWRGFRLLDGDQVRARAEYVETLASDHYAGMAGAGLPADAGSLSIAAGDRLGLRGRLATGGGGRGSYVDIAADRLEVVNSVTGAGDRIEIVAADLARLGADSLLLGGRRSRGAGGVGIETLSDAVTIAAGVRLTLPELLLVATDEVAVAGNAVLRGAGSARVGGERLLLAGDGALLRVSTGAQVGLTRGASPGLAGTLTVAAGATLGASGSMTLDATLNTSFAGLLDSTGGALLLGANRISLGDTAAVGEGLRLPNALLATLSAADLTLVSRTSIDFIGDVGLGSPARPLDRITLDAGALRGFGGDATLRADRIELTHGGDAVIGAGGAAAGTLTLAGSDAVTLGGGDYAVHGYTGLRLASPGDLLAQGRGSLTTTADVDIAAGRIGGRRGADLALATSGDIVIDGTPGTHAGALTELGARWALTGASLEVGGRFVLPSGTLELTATTGDLRVAAGAVIDVAGLDLAFVDRAVGSPGGQVTLVSAGDLDIAAGARVDAGGAAAGGDAGGIALRARGGTVDIAAGARLAATAAGGTRGGRFDLDAGALGSNLDALGATLDTGGFRDVLALRLHSGNIDVGAGTRLRARRITLTADAGSVSIAGTLDARGDDGGRVALNAAGDVTLAASARVDASGTAAGSRDGGEVLLESRGGTIDIAATDAPGAASIAAGAGDGSDAGLVRLTAAQGPGGLVNGSLAGTIMGAERVELVGRRLYTGVTTLDGARYAAVTGDAESFMAGAAAIETALGVAGDPRYHVMPGIEIQGTGTLTLTSDWDFAYSRPGGEPGVLVLRAAGDLRLDRSLSDGVVNADLFGFGDLRDVADLAGAFGIAGGERAWSWRAVAGADLASADALAVVAGTGDLRIGAGQRVRTGVGGIELAAGRDLAFADGAAAVYTVGRARAPAPADFGDSAFFVQIVQQLLLGGEFLQDGGDISLAAGRDILAVDGGQLWSEWLPRLGGTFAVDVSDPGINPEALTASPSMVGVAIERFAQGVAALGGGDIDIRAGRDIRDLSVSIPTTLMPTAKSVGVAAAAGGGDLDLAAGRDVLGGRYYVDAGQGRIAAGNDVRARADGEVNPVLALAGDATLAVTARGDLVLGSALNPTLLLPSATQGGLGGFGAGERSYFFSYGERAAVALSAIAGDVVLVNDAGDILGLSDNLVVELSDATGVNRVPIIYPGTLSAIALQGDLDIRGSFDLYPTPRGTLDLLAGGSVYSDDIALVTLSDADPLRLPTLAAPAASLTAPVAAFFSEGNPDGLFHAATPVHAGDDGIVRVVARTGIVGSPENSLILNLSKPVLVSAGLDVVNLTLIAQHAGRDQVSTVAAGRDIVYPSARGASGNFESNIGKRFEIAGPGRIDFLAGRNIDLGTSAGIRTTGDTGNQALGAIDETGAAILLVAGLADGVPDYPGYFAFQEEVFGAAAPELAFHDVPRATGPDDRGALFDSLFGLVTASGAYALQSGTDDYSLGYAALDALFPAGGDWAGDVSLLLSRVATEDGGGIGIATPGGGVNAGVTATSVIRKTAAELGIVAQGAGDIDALVRDDFLVNESRVFTLGGGDILIWSSDGSIDAGRGAKSAISAPPPFTVTDAGGNTVLVFPPAISGSGIRTVASGSDTVAGDVFLFAPRGIVSAGDAGIGGENILVGATEVLGADNIDVGGVSVGVPAAAGGSLAVGLTGVGDVAGSATRSATDASERAGEDGAGGTAGAEAPVLAVLTVEVLGFGDGEDEEEP